MKDQEFSNNNKLVFATFVILTIIVIMAITYQC